MTGSEKQVKWASEIMENVLATIKSNKAICESSTVAPIKAKAETWAYMEKRYEEMFETELFQDASKIIDQRNAKVFDVNQIANEIETIAKNCNISRTDAAKRVIG